MSYGVLRKDQVPIGGYFRCRQNGLKNPIQHPYFRETFGRVNTFRKSNALPLLTEAEFESCVCAEQPEICGEIETGDAQPVTMAGRLLKFTRSIAQWASQGFAAVTTEVYENRWTTCSGGGVQTACPFWNGESYFGYGSCEKCGCTRLKLMATTEKCPIGKW